MPAATSQLPSLSTPQYRPKAGDTNQFQTDESGYQKLNFGYFGEAGGLPSAAEKADRDRLAGSFSDLVAEEFGDVLQDLINITVSADVNPDETGASCIAYLRSEFGERRKSPLLLMILRHIDSLMKMRKSLDHPCQLARLANRAGVLAEVPLTSIRASSPSSHSLNLGFHLAELAVPGASLDLKIEDMARNNIDKILSRWPDDKTVYLPPFDFVRPYHEQFPAKLAMESNERGTPRRLYYAELAAHAHWGRLNEPDEYRFHDVIHLAYVAFPDWSLVVRTAQTQAQIRPQDGREQGGSPRKDHRGRYRDLDPNHTQSPEFYIDAKPNALDYSVLRQIESMVEGYEVEACKLWQWEKAILTGFQVFPEQQIGLCGTVHVNVLEHTMCFDPLEKKEQP